MDVSLNKRFFRILDIRAIHLAVFFGVLFALKIVLLYSCYNHGMGFVNSDEVARVIFSKRFAETGDYSSFEYFWLPLPFMIVGLIGKLINNEYYIATIGTNTIWSFGTMCYSVFWLLRLLSRRIIGSPFKYWSIAIGIGCVAITLPWQTIGSLSGFSEPLSWLGVVGATTVLMRMEEVRKSGDLRAIWVGFLLAVANFTRYECWVITAFMIPILFWLGRPTSKMNTRGVMQLLPAVLASLVAIAPIVFWIYVNQREFGDPLRMLEFTHRFETSLVGESNSIATMISFLKLSVATNPLLLIMVALCACLRMGSLKNLIQFMLPLASLVMILFSVSMKGIPWMVGERTLALYCFWFFCPAFDFLTDRMSARPKLLLGVCILFTIINLTCLRAMPLESAYTKQLLAREVVQHLNKKLPQGRRPKIAFLGADAYEDAMYLIWPVIGDFIPLPAD